ncbi:hypothetical protein TrRE_jg13082, partial [Triparma retinervis]
TVKEEFGPGDTEVITGPGLHRAPMGVKEFVVEASVGEKEVKVEDALRDGKCPRTLVFCNTVEGVRRVTNHLKRRDRGGKVWNVVAYHGGMTQDARDRSMGSFCVGRPGVDGVMVATDRAARGVDFGGRHVGHVVIYEFPKTTAEYCALLYLFVAVSIQPPDDATRLSSLLSSPSIHSTRLQSSRAP